MSVTVTQNSSWSDGSQPFPTCGLPTAAFYERKKDAWWSSDKLYKQA